MTLGLVPKQHSTGGKSRLGKASKMGRQRDIRTLLVSGAMAVLQTARAIDTPNNGWLKCLLTRKPRMVAAIALANIPLTHAAHVLSGNGWRVASGP